MASVNKVILVGNLGRDPETRTMPDGTTVCNIQMATSYQWKDKTTGERREEVEWHRVACFGRMAEIAAEYLKKGRSVYIEGRLKTHKWQDKDGIDRYTTQIIADQMQMLGGRDDADAGDRAPRAQGNDGERQPTARKDQRRPAPKASAAGRYLEDVDDDIPF